MKYHIRVPIKAKIVIRVAGPMPKDLEGLVRSKFDEGKYLTTCEQIFPDERQIVQVCDECGAELDNDLEHEIGLCSECQKAHDQQKLEESRAQ